MTLKEMKLKILRMIEEVSDSEKLTDDPDIEAKLNDIINQIMFEVARIKKIPMKSTEQITEEDLEYDMKMLDDFYQVGKIKFFNTDGKRSSFEIFGDLIEFSEAGTANIYYYKYPTRITDATDENEYNFELTDDALEIIPYGVAGDLLKSDVSSNYGKTYSERYETMLQRLDPRYAMDFIEYEGGVEI